MLRTVSCLALAACALAWLIPAATAEGKELSGIYMETRTCQVYTGPCFANAEIGLAGQDAIMAWRVEKGGYQGIDLAGLSVVMVLKASDTLAFRGIDSVASVKSVILVDQKANEAQRDALIQLAKDRAGKAGQAVVRVDVVPIQMSLDTAALQGNLTAGDAVELKTRAARRGDCICSNESAYYPPLTQVSNFAPGVTIEGRFQGRGLGSNWSTPESRSAYMATFDY